MSKQFEQFYSGFRSDVIDLANSDEGYPQKEQAFTALIAEDLSQAGILESPDICYFEHGGGNTLKKANAYSVPEEDSSLDLVVTLFYGREEPPSVNMQDLDRAFNQLSRFLKAGLDGYHEEIESGSDAFQMLQHVHSLKKDLDRVRFFLFTDGRISVRSNKKTKNKVGSLPVSYEIWDIERIFRFRSSTASHEPVELDLTFLPEGGLPCATGGSANIGYDTKCAIIPGRILADLYDEHGQRLLELNVRSYLQARGKVNKGIMETLFEMPERFLAYNNGITIVAESLQTGTLKNGSEGITEIKGLQIVNGGQTTASIHRASKPEKAGKNKGKSAELDKVFVQAKITVIQKDKFDTLVPLISKFSNTQNKVTEVDLRANHPFHTGFERASRTIWAPGEKSLWYYERARGSYQTDKAREATTQKRKKAFEEKHPTSQKILPTDLAKYNNCWNGEPHIASKGGQKSFVYFMESVGKREDNWKPSEEEYKQHIAKAILYKNTYKICKKVGYTSQQSHCCNYTVAAIASRTARRVNLKSIWDKQSISEALENMIWEWSPKIMERMANSAGTGNPTEWYKKLECWKDIQQMDLQLSPDFEAELTGVETFENVTVKRGSKKKPEKLSQEDQNNIAHCREVSAARWHDIATWGSKSGKLQEWEVGIANSLSGYSMNGWPGGKPTKKQAKHGVRILTIAESENI